MKQGPGRDGVRGGIPSASGMSGGAGRSMTNKQQLKNLRPSGMSNKKKLEGLRPGLTANQQKLKNLRKGPGKK